MNFKAFAQIVVDPRFDAGGERKMQIFQLLVGEKKKMRKLNEKTRTNENKEKTK